MRAVYLTLFYLFWFGRISPGDSGHPNRLQLWIDEEQVSDSFPEWPSEIVIIKDGMVNSYLRNPDLEKYMPILPANLETVNLKWKAGDVRYSYRFDELTSLNLSLLYNPLLSITTSGEIPSRQSDFQVAIPCTGHKDGVAHLSLGLQVFDHSGKAIEGSPIKFRLRKHCKAHALCYPKCENNGTCISPEKCACREGYYGKYCEKALCKERCQNGGRCVKKDHCWCAPDFYGEACQYPTLTMDRDSWRVEVQDQTRNPGSPDSRLLTALLEAASLLEERHNPTISTSLSNKHCNKSPCKNGGTCVGNNACRCPPGFYGTICDIVKMDADRTRRSHVNGQKRKRNKRPNKRRKRRKRMRAKKRNKKKRRKWKRLKRKKKKVKRKPV